MRVDTVIRRRIVFALVAAALLVGQPQAAWAKQDWWGWLEELSGPGPFNGFELSAEIMCLNLAERREVPLKELRAKVPELAAAGKALDGALTNLATAGSGFPEVTGSIGAIRRRLAGVPMKGDADLASLLTTLRSRERALGFPGAALADFDRAYERRQQLVSQAVLASIVGGAGIPGAPAVEATTSFDVSAPDWKSASRSCRGAQPAIDADRQADRARTAELLAVEGLHVLTANVDARPEDSSLVVSRRDFQTGIVVSAGGYWSVENKLFDPTGTRDDEPQLRIIPVEVLAHSKVSSSIDIGAGVGVAFFHTDFRNDPWAPTKPAAFYLVPLSVVVRPARLFTNDHWASILGYRVSLRYLGNVDAADFGSPTGTYKQHGEFVWGAAGFVDLVALFGR